MAAEKTEPRIGIIVSVAIGSIVSVLALHAALVSYFAAQTGEEQQVKYLGAVPEQRNHQREYERQRLDNGPVPIEQAMQIVAQGGRPAVIAPRPSVDYAPMTGWTQRPLQFTPPPAMTGGPSVVSAPSTPPAATGNTTAGPTATQTDPNPAAPRP